MRKHVEKEHPEKECPAEAIISKAEKGILQKTQARVANALSVKDLEKLDDNELKHTYLYLEINQLNKGFCFLAR